MENQKVEPRWFLIKDCSCGAVFALNTHRFPQSYDKKRTQKKKPNNDFDINCPGCLRIMGDDLEKELYSFLNKYKRLVQLFDAEKFTIREVKIEDLSP